MRSRLVTLCLLSLALAIPGSAQEEPVARPGADPLTAPTTLTTSIGGPANGRLEGAIALPDRGPGWRSNANRPNREAYYGTVELVRLLMRASSAAHRVDPEIEVVINDLGFREGGPIPHHGSHRAGRDVDILFQYRTRDGERFPAKGIPVDRRGRGWDFGDLADGDDDVEVRLDVPGTWAFVRALLEDAEDGPLVQRIFLVEHVRTMLLEHATRSRAPRAIRQRFADVTCQPSAPHDDHLHLRLFCTAEDLRAGCADGPPMYPSRRAELRALGLEPVMAAPRPRTPRAAQPEPDLSGFHPRVRRFLEDRETWSEQPHPGRRWCR